MERLGFGRNCEIKVAAGIGWHFKNYATFILKFQFYAFFVKFSAHPKIKLS